MTIHESYAQTPREALQERKDTLDKQYWDLQDALSAVVMERAVVMDLLAERIPEQPC